MAESRATIEKEEIDADKALSRVLAEDVYATEAIPPFRASIKDGYAVRTSDGVGDRVVRDVSAAGDIVGSVNVLKFLVSVMLFCFSLSKIV